MNDVLDDSLLMPTLSKKRDRVFAAMIDLGLTVIVAIIITTTFGNPYETADGRSGYRLTGPLTLIPLFLWVLIVPALEGFTGQSLGKSFLKIKVVSKDHSKPTFGQIMVRHLFDLVDWLPGFGIVGLLVASNNEYRQRVGDLVAKTIVVKK